MEFVTTLIHLCNNLIFSIFNFVASFLKMNSIEEKSSVENNVGEQHVEQNGVQNKASD